jgi:hypothetical protein
MQRPQYDSIFDDDDDEGDTATDLEVSMNSASSFSSSFTSSDSFNSQMSFDSNSLGSPAPKNPRYNIQKQVGKGGFGTVYLVCVLFIMSVNIDLLYFTGRRY